MSQNLFVLGFILGANIDLYIILYVRRMSSSSYMRTWKPTLTNKYIKF